MTRLRLGLALLLAGAALPAHAQSRGPLDARVDRVERELRAVQRKVFPDGAPAFSEPEIAPPAAQAAPPPAEGGSALNALTTRVESLESALQQLTGQVEQIQHRLSVASEQAAKDRQEFDTRLKAIEMPVAPAATPSADAPAPADDAAVPATSPFRTVPAARGARPGASRTRAPRAADADLDAPASPPAAAAPAGPTSDAPAASTGDPAEDGYMAGYQLWSQKKYPEAEAALKKVVAKYPKHRRASYAQNLLGRAYLDDGQPATAAEAFASNYQTNPRGERAPDSLFYLGQALIQLKKPADACRVYDELDSAYGATLSASLKTREAAARRDAKCK